MAWSKTTYGDYVTFSESLAVADSAGANVVTVNSSEIKSSEYAWENKILGLHIDITEVSAGDGAYNVKALISTDGVNYADSGVNAGMDVDPRNVANDASGKIDLSNVYAPFLKLQIFTDGTDTQDAAACTLKVSVPVETNAGLVAGDFGGIGKDPS